MVLLWAAFATYVKAQGSATVHVGRIQGVINPVMASYVQSVIREAEEANATAVVLEMDTPGGLMTSMRDITGAILNSRVPVVVYVSPQGARAASAGVFVTMASHVAAMAPNTNIGSAHPVGIGEGEQMDETMAEKVVNDAVAQVRDMAERRGRNAEWAEKAVRESLNATSREALELKVIDLVADDLPSLLRAIDGREVLMADGRTVTLATRDASLIRHDMNPIESFLHAIADPTIAYILLTLGINALIFELASPGAVLPGVAGVILILLALYSLGTLSVNLTGVLLVVVGFALLVAEVLIAPGYGVLGVGGIIALVMGSLILMQASSPFLSVSPYAVAGVILGTLLFFFIALRGIIRSRRRQVTTGKEGLVGALGEARTDLKPRGYVFVDGERWEAVSKQQVAAGEQVRVLAVNGFTLVVEPVSAAEMERPFPSPRSEQLGTREQPARTAEAEDRPGQKHALS